MLLAKILMMSLETQGPSVEALWELKQELVRKRFLQGPTPNELPHYLREGAQWKSVNWSMGMD